MKMKYWALGIVGLVITLGGSNCKKRPKECNSHIPLHPQAYTYFVFEKGSYWIYKDEQSGDMDTVTINQFNERDYWAYKVLGTKDCPCFKQFGLDYNHSYFKNLIDGISVEANISFKNKTNESNVIIQGTLNKMPLDEYRFIWREYAPGLWHETGSGAGSVALLDSMKTKDSTYHKVIRLQYPKFYIGQDWLLELYVAPNIGTIRFVDSANRTWNLINYNVIQTTK